MKQTEWQNCLTVKQKVVSRVILDFRCGLSEIVDLLGCYAASGRTIPTFRAVSFPSSRANLDCMTLEDGNDRLSRNVGDLTSPRGVTAQKTRIFISTAVITSVHATGSICRS